MQLVDRLLGYRYWPTSSAAYEAFRQAIRDAIAKGEDIHPSEGIEEMREYIYPGKWCLDIMGGEKMQNNRGFVKIKKVKEDSQGSERWRISIVDRYQPFIPNKG